MGTFGGTSYIYAEKDTPWKPPNEPLFRFGATSDLVKQMVNIKDRVLFKVFTNLIEIILMKGVDEYDLAMAIWLLSHCEGHLLVNLPTADNPKKLVHIANITKSSKIPAIVHAIVGHLVRYPTHLVFQTKFSTAKSIFTNESVTNRVSMGKIYERVKLDYMEKKI